MKCEQARLLMNAKLDGEIDEKQMSQLNAHIDSCESCTIEFEDLKYISQTLEDLELKTLPSGFEDELHKKLLLAKDEMRFTEKKAPNINKTKILSKKYFGFAAAAAVFAIIVFTAPRLMYQTKSANFESEDMYATGVMDSNRAAVEESGVMNEMAPSEAPETPEAAKAGMVDSVSLTMTESTEDEYRDGRMIIQSTNISLDIEQYDTVVNQITQWVNESGGYIESHSTNLKTYYSDSDNLKQGYLTLRIPAAGYGTLVGQIKSLGLVLNESSNASDVTKAYRDTASELENLKVTEKRFREILSQATAIEDILSIENELTRIRGQINSYNKQLKDWEALVDLTTVTVSLNEVKSLKPTIEKIDDSLWGKSKEGFINTVNQMRRAFEQFIVWLISSIPVLVVLIIIGIIISIFYKRRKKNEK